jgi:uncharacterized protein YndB with AHSA1/START domain
VTSQTNNTSETTLTLPSNREILIQRTFDAPRRLVFEALTKPEHVAQWYGPRYLKLQVCEIDFRVGGRWRYVLRDPEGNEHGFSGEYREIVPPERVVTTEGYEAMPGHEYVATLTLDEQDGKTTLRSHLVYQSPEDRDGHIQSGMEPGMRETYDRLAELLATLA